MQTETGRTSRRAAFTLVELLVVIGIIAVLIGILLPALSRARDTARRTTCLANQRQILTAILMYVNDSKGVLPGPVAPVVCDPRVVNIQPGQTKSLMDTWNGGTYYSTRQMSSVSLLQRYLGGSGSWGVWQCPAATAMYATPNIATSTYFGGKQIGFGYLLNDTDQAGSTYPTFLFGSYTASDTATEQSPKRVTSIKYVAQWDPTLNLKGVYAQGSQKVWLLSDIDGRNGSTTTSGAFALVAGASGDTTVQINARLWQPVHSLSRAMPSDASPTSGGLARNYGFLDGHAEFLVIGNWPGASNTKAFK